MTLLEKCRELYPNGKLDKDGLPPLCPCMLEGMNLDRQDLNDCNIRKCKDCWNREYKEANDEEN